MLGEGAYQHMENNNLHACCQNFTDGQFIQFGKVFKTTISENFLDFGQVLKFFNKEKGQVGTLYKYCPLQHGQTSLTCLGQVKMNDSAEFCCLAENSFGAANTTIVLIVEVSH